MPRELPKLKASFHKPVMANVSGFSVEDYAYTCRLLDQQEQVGWLEVNVSCPNVPWRRHELRYRPQGSCGSNRSG